MITKHTPDIHQKPTGPQLGGSSAKKRAQPIIAGTSNGNPTERIATLTRSRTVSAASFATVRCSSTVLVRSWLAWLCLRNLTAAIFCSSASRTFSLAEGGILGTLRALMTLPLRMVMCNNSLALKLFVAQVCT